MIREKVLAYLEDAQPAPRYKAFAFGQKKLTPEERIAHIKQRINVARTKIETLSHQLQKVSDNSKRTELNALKRKTETLLQNLKSKLEEVSKFAREFKQGLKGKHGVTASLAAQTQDHLKVLSKDVAALEGMAFDFRRQGDALLREAFEEEKGIS